MEITNKLGLPQPLYKAILWQQSNHSVGDAHLSCTQLIDSPLIAWLWRHYGDQVQEDAAERLWPLYGSLMHNLLEQFAGDGEHVEVEAISEVDGVRVSGHIDLVVQHDGTLQDYKFTSAWTVSHALKEGKPEWERQLNVYRFLLDNSIADLKLPSIDKLQIVALLRDWGPRHQRDGLQPVHIIDVPLWPDAQALSYMKERIALHQAAWSEEVPPICTPEERWAEPTQFAVMKKGRKSALRVFESKAEAETWMRLNQGDAIEVRLGKDKRCSGYCPFGKQNLCPYRQSI